MTSPPSQAGSTPPPGQVRPNPKAGSPAARTAGRAQLAKNARFAELSPEVGVLDEAAVRRALDDDPAETFALLVAMTGATDEALRRQALDLGRRIVLDRARAGVPRAGGTAKLRLAPASAGGDVDVDRSLDGILGARGEGRPVGLDDLVTRQWGRPATALVVVVDRSGSMTGDRLAVAAVVAAACAARAPGEHAVLAFSSGVDVLRPLVADVPAERVVESLLRLRGHGVTRLADALQAASDQLAAARASRRVVVLLSDCRSTDEDDSLELARALPELVILAPAGDCDQARHLAEQAGARWAALDDPTSAAAALDDLLGSAPA